MEWLAEQEKGGLNRATAPAIGFDAISSDHSASAQARMLISARNGLTAAGDREFKSGFLQRGCWCEPDLRPRRCSAALDRTTKFRISAIPPACCRALQDQISSACRNPRPLLRLQGRCASRKRIAIVAQLVEQVALNTGASSTVANIARHVPGGTKLEDVGNPPRVLRAVRDR
jgi:hypothetical protein